MRGLFRCMRLRRMHWKPIKVEWQANWARGSRQVNAGRVLWRVISRESIRESNQTVFGRVKQYFAILKNKKTSKPHGFEVFWSECNYRISENADISTVCWQSARGIYSKVILLINRLSVFVNFICVDEAANKLGWAVGSAIGTISGFMILATGIGVSCTLI